jgi:glycosyltransferase involved in cell wall biosynthesis
VNLLYTITAYPPSIGGAQLHTQQLSKAMSVNHAVQVVSIWDTNRTDWLMGTTLRAAGRPHDYIQEGIPVHRMGFNMLEKTAMIPAVLVYYPLMDIALPYLSAITRSHLEPFTSNASLIHNVRVGREPLSFASLQTARRRDIPFFFTPLHHPRWRGWLYRHYHNIYMQADAVFALTQVEKQTLVELGVEENRITVTGIGPVLADSADEKAFRQKYKLADDPMVLFLGQKYVYKGVEALLNAAPLVWQRFPETRFAVIGPRTEYSIKLFRTVNDHRILEMDSVSLQEKTDALAACTLLCVPSSQESFGGVYTEAWSFGKPVIGCPIPAVSELIIDGVDGCLVRQHSVEIADRILALISEPDLAHSMGIAGQRKVEDRYTWQNLSAITERAYQDILS